MFEVLELLFGIALAVVGVFAIAMMICFFVLCIEIAKRKDDKNERSKSE